MKLDSSLAAIVTGGASGLGEARRACWQASASRSRSWISTPSAARRSRKRSAACSSACDVTSEASVDAALATARAAQGVARIMVNCAGIAPGRRVVSKKRDTGELVAHDIAKPSRTALAINLTGTFRVIAKSAVALAALDPITRMAAVA
jgi:NAD(P)-dependent dehydrogenase (short-subunit alcohol dehydrogenase family)